MWTRDKIVNLLNTNDRAEGRAMVALYEWVDLVKLLLNIGDRAINFTTTDTHQVFINYYNLPVEDAKANRGGGAEADNNRIMLTVHFPGYKSWYDKPVKEGKVRVFTSVMTVKSEVLRGKTATPAKIAEYVAQFLNKVAKDIPPNFTHKHTPIG